MISKQNGITKYKFRYPNCGAEGKIVEPISVWFGAVSPFHITGLHHILACSLFLVWNVILTGVKVTFR